MHRLHAVVLVGLLFATPQTLAQEPHADGHDHGAALPGEPPDGDAARGSNFFKVCMTCHGMNAEGNPTLGTPRLAGQFPWYLERQLRHFKRGVRGADPRDLYGAQMRQMVQTLPDEQAIRDVVAYIGTLPHGRAEATVGGDPQRGRDIFIQCAACHGPDGRGTELLNAPILRGMSDYYLARQLQNFRSGVRGHHRDDKFGLHMASVSSQLLASEEDIADVLAYVNSLP